MGGLYREIARLRTRAAMPFQGPGAASWCSSRRHANGHGYVLADQSARYAPTEWARTAIALYRQHKADRIVAEVNNGGDMVEATIRMVDPNVGYSAVRASRSKVIRAEPIAPFYEQGRIHHVGTLPRSRISNARLPPILTGPQRDIHPTGSTPLFGHLAISSSNK